MITKKNVFLALALLTACLMAVLAACNGSDDGGNSSQPVTLSFAAVVGTQSIADNTTKFTVGTTSASGTLNEAKFYVSDIKLIRSDGVHVPLTLDQNSFQRDNVALVSFIDNSLPTQNVGKHDNVTGTVPAGTYTGVVFSLGVPESQNHQNVNTAQPPLDKASMFWNWQGGYKFVRFDFRPDTPDVSLPAGIWNFHLGSTGCSTIPPVPPATDCTYLCTVPNRPEITFTTFNPATEKIVFNYGTLVSGENMTADTGGAAGCMSGSTDLECDTLFIKLGFTGVNQTVFTKALK